MHFEIVISCKSDEMEPVEDLVEALKLMVPYFVDNVDILMVQEPEEMEENAKAQR